MFVSQFYRCFLILFHCKHPLTENGHSSMPSKTTMVQLNRRVCDSSPAATGCAAAAAATFRPLTGPGTPDKEGTSTAESDRTDSAQPPEISSWELLLKSSHETLSWTSSPEDISCGANGQPRPHRKTGHDVWLMSPQVSGSMSVQWLFHMTNGLKVWRSNSAVVSDFCSNKFKVKVKHGTTWM